MKLKDKIVFITDASSQCGFAIAERFKAEGAVLCLNAYPEALWRATTFAEILLADGGFLTHANPVVKKEVDAAVAAAVGKYGRIDVVVHNNNEAAKAGLEDCGDEAFDRALAINAKSAFLFAQAAAGPMKKAGKGSFVFISSIHDEKPNGAAFAYSIAKGALKMMVKEMVLDLGPSNIRANIVSMGPMEGADGLFSSDLSPLYEHAKERIPDMRFCTFDEVAAAALFFASDDCPSANGGCLALDGGFLLSYYSGRKRK